MAVTTSALTSATLRMWSSSGPLGNREASPLQAAPCPRCGGPGYFPSVLARSGLKCASVQARRVAPPLVAFANAVCDRVWTGRRITPSA